ncbi:hypothetical protein HF325_000440 [Metschnikowia pulcherrima]|uniref:Acyl-CoA thioesterase II n=1 Tax=Metschnikowia pulcherrima TaxID=27326 RepID=A0A8H7GWZ9_9ASCO|nr:hypothetical protein HF325_000440 [Metschnikowia pulcherrima]
MPGNPEPEHALDFEQETGVRQIDNSTWEGIYPLKLPLQGARGVYGGHICAQTLLVAIKSAPGHIPHSYHSNFIKPGDATVKCTYKVKGINNGTTSCLRQIYVFQRDRIIYTAVCALVKKGMECDSSIGRPQFAPKTPEQAKSSLSKVYKTHHTDFIVNGFSDEFLNHELCPEEKGLPISERWICLSSKLHQPQKGTMHDSDFNYVGLAHLSDGAILTTLARALHLNWNPTVKNAKEEFDANKDARQLMNVSLNVMHIYHYTAMSLDHHLYFHSDLDLLDLINNWLSLTYQYKVSKNSRTLVRGHFFDHNGTCVATFFQEGLTYMRPGVAGRAEEKFSKF